MKKTIEIKQRKLDGTMICTECPFRSGYQCSQDLGKLTSFSCNGGAYIAPSDKCPGPGKYRMSLEKVFEFDCPKCKSVQEYRIMEICRLNANCEKTICCLKCGCLYKKWNDEPYQLFQEAQELRIE